MFSQKLQITEAGMTLLVRAAGGEQIAFTRFQAGSGILEEGENPRSMTALKEAVLENIGITQADDTAESGFIELTGEFNNQTDVEEQFLWTELGLLAEDSDGQEYLYAYGYDIMNAESVRPASTGGVIMQQRITALIAIGESENITVNVLPASTYASATEFSEHKNNQSNPHGVTCEQVGAAPVSHSHNTTDIVGGILPVARGGTGFNKMTDLINAILKAEYVIGTYEGDRSQRKNIVLGFQPFMVCLIPMCKEPQVLYMARQGDRESLILPITFEAGYNYTSSDMYKTRSADQLFASGFGGAAVTSNGFAVGYGTKETETNQLYYRYLYIAIKPKVA